MQQLGKEPHLHDQVSKNAVSKSIIRDPTKFTDKSRWITIHFQNGRCTRPVPDNTTTIRVLIMGANRLQNYHNKLHEMAMWVAVLADLNLEEYEPDLRQGINFDEPAEKYKGCHLYFDSKFNIVPKVLHSWKILEKLEKLKKLNKACHFCYKTWETKTRLRQLVSGNGGLPSHVCLRCSTLIHENCLTDFLTQDNGCVTPTKPRISLKEHNHEWQIQSHDVKIKQQIGKGCYGTVYKCDWFGDHAVKVLNVMDMERHDDFVNEMKLLHRAKHSNILMFVGFCNAIFIEDMNETRPGMVTELCPGKTLYYHIHQKSEGDAGFEMNTINKVNIARQIANGMNYLTSEPRRIIHRDLKSPNVFITDGVSVKIGDFGLATKVGNQSSDCVAGSVLWMSPQICSFSKKRRDSRTLKASIKSGQSSLVTQAKAEEVYCEKSDVYAFGVILYELFLEELPYKNIDHGQIILFRVGMGSLKLYDELEKVLEDSDNKKLLPPAIKLGIKFCCEFEVDARPAFESVAGLLNSIHEILQQDMMIEGPLKVCHDFHDMCDCLEPEFRLIRESLKGMESWQKLDN